MMPSESIPSLAQFRSLIQQRLGLDLSGEEIAELVWMAIAQGLESPSETIREEAETGTEIIRSDNRTTVPTLPIEQPPSVSIASLVSALTERSLDRRGAMSVQIPDAIALRNRREIERSLRPLMRKVPSQHQRVMLEEATATRIAQKQIWEAVMGPEPERWLDLAIVIEVTNVYAVWRETLEEFRVLLERHGAFRSVKTWHLKANESGNVELFLQRGRREGVYSTPRNPRELLSGNGRRLVLVMSDCTSASWRSQQIPHLLKLWSQENPVTIVQLLPPMYWDRTALRSGVAVGLRSAVPGALSRDWRVEGLSAVRRRRLPTDGLKLPVVTIDPGALGTWARAMGSIEDGMTAGVMLEISPLAPNSGGTGVEEVTGEEVVRRFRSMASGEAQELAAVLAMFPVTNAVVRLVQKVVLEESAALFLAEMVLSGVLVAVEGRSGQDYDFADGVRSALVSRLESAVALDVVDEVAEEVMSQLPNAEEVRARISADIERRYGESLRSFKAFLIPDLDWGDEAVKGEMMVFGSVMESVLRTWGGEFEELCDQMLQSKEKYISESPRYALVIGIGENEAPLASLSKPVDDARAIAAVLRSVGGFEVQECVGRVERQDLERAIERLLEQAEGQEALIYYTGHAVPLRKAFGQMEALLAGSDCVVVAEDGMAVQQQNGLLLEDLNQVLGAANLGNLVLLLDCCHSGYLLEKQLLQQTFTNFAKKNYLLITACRSFEQAYANRSDRHSLFTGAVLAGLGRENADEQGVVTGDRLFAFVSRQLEGSGQEALRLSVGRPIELVRYPLETVTESIEPTLQMTNPYQGLKAFTAETRQFFFGRDREIQALVQKVQGCGFVPVIGASGSGKSSVVRAGLIPRLEELGWRVLHVMIPGTDPILALQSSIATLEPSTENTLLVVDQFEEVFTLCRNRSEQSKFIQALMNLKLRVVVTMRADFVEACLADADLTRSIQDNAVYLGPMVGAALESAIEQPAIMQGATLQPKLLAQILQDVEAEENSLPLLEFALSQLWEKKVGSELTLGIYQQLGGIAGALDTHAEGLYKTLASQRREQWVKPILLRLVRMGEGTGYIRQRQRKYDLLGIGKDAVEKASIESVIQSLVDGRLLVSDRVGNQDVIDLSHAILMESWKRLVKWQERAREENLQEEDPKRRTIRDSVRNIVKNWWNPS